MAAFSTLFSFFILCLLLSSLQIQARDSHFFNKVSRSNTPQETKPVNTPASEPKQQEPEEYPQSRNGYGLYSSNSNSQQLGGEDSLGNEYGNAVLPSKYSTDEFADEQSYKNKDFTNSYTSNSEYTTNKYGGEHGNDQSYKNKEYTTSFASNEYQNNQYGEEYGNGQSQNYKNKESTTSYPSSEYQNKQYGEEYSNDQSYKSRKSTTNQYQNEQYGGEYKDDLSYGNKESTTTYPASDYRNKKYGGEYKDDLSYGNKESTTTYPDSDYRNKKYGMSDTRFLENGKYFYDVENSAKNQYVSKGSNQGYDPSRNAKAQNRYSNNGYDGNNEHVYESNNSYQNNQEETEDDDFLP
ncbi:hypothetical protein ACLOJK_009821 [Asimina triloba]